MRSGLVRMLLFGVRPFAGMVCLLTLSDDSAVSAILDAIFREWRLLFAGEKLMNAVKMMCRYLC